MNNKNLFCPNCGHSIKPNNEFCQNCGFNLKNINKANNDNSSQNGDNQESNQDNNSLNGENNQSYSPQRSSNQHRMKHSKLKLSILAIVVIILVGGYLFGQNYYSKASTMNRIISGLQNGNNVTSSFYTSDPSYKMSSDSLDPLSNYFDDNKDKLSSFKSQLMNDGVTNNGNFEYKENGHNFLIFPRYQVKAKTIYPSVYTNRDNVNIQLNDKHLVTSNTDDYQKKIGPILPGQYALKATGKVNGKSISNDGKYYLSNNSDSVNLVLKTIKFNVSAAPKSVIYINDKRQGVVDDSGNYKLSEMPFSSNMVVTAKYGNINSNPTKVTSDDNDSTVNVTYPGSVSKDDVQSLLDNVSDSMQDVVSDGNDGDNGLEDSFVGGSDNQSYQQIHDWAIAQHKNDDINSVDLTNDIQSITPGHDGTSIIGYNVKYIFDSDDSDNTQVFRWNATVKKIGDNLKIVKTSSDNKPISQHKEDN
ncbi:zinc-ribbon domain-containing protein [Apilactobacillus micheneri]|uniref:zinc ribbon domain-containing protein n=1 Tax=Apilactobacillus micheneri TaxID=1899430 RepID=UPI00112BE46D|nr:zinc-ribbon domain-containing protein [Apilactobacillus micheneri]TPR50395.1 zinc-ribbon domain-containing protein [Apilactobacillus micheneri]